MMNDVRIERRTINTNRTRHRIVAGFPGVGKSTAASMYSHKFIDMESSYYHWIFDESNGTKICHPKWPINYVDAIIKVATSEISFNVDRVIICISTHKEVLDELTNRGIYFDAVCPSSKDIYIQRYIDRGNNEAFVELLQNKFESFVQDLGNSNAGIIYFTDGYFADLFYDRNNRYRDITITHNLNSNAFPTNYTDKIIIAVWPMSWATSLDEEAINRLAHFIHPSIMTPYFAKPTYDELDFLICSSAYCEYAKVLADTDAYQETKYIVIDGYSSVIDRISDSDTNFIIITPESYEKFKEYNGYYHELSMTEEEFIEYRKNLMGKTFHLITCDNLNKIFQDAHMLDAGINP